MNNMYNSFTDTEISKLLKSLVILQDSRENSAKHITDYFEDKRRNIRYKVKALSSGDYSCYIESNEETKNLIGTRNMYFDKVIAIERKNGLTELAGSIKDRQRFEFEFMRAKNRGTKMFLIVEEKDGYSNMRRGNYRSEYNANALTGSLMDFISKYDISLMFADRIEMGDLIYNILKYHVRRILKES